MRGGGVFRAMRALLQLPEACPACRGPSEAGFCRGCAGEFRRVAAPCSRCGLPSPGHLCPAGGPGWHVGRVVTPFEYMPPLTAYLQALKFKHGRTLGRALGLLLADEVSTRGEAGALYCDAIVPVPLSPHRMRTRGYNQSIELGRVLARAVGVRLVVTGVRRPAERARQAGLGARARHDNVACAFAVERRFHGQRIAIVDDVVTTGATVNALAAELLAAGAAGVAAVAVARTLTSAQSPAATLDGALPPRSA